MKIANKNLSGGAEEGVLGGSDNKARIYDEQNDLFERLFSEKERKKKSHWQTFRIED